ncbi:peptidase M24, structural domain-containing protein [Talaromyces proteolyticus]|uniref:Peptidase M24, structural domain-containing protein n=1 Tax=Talaromyces proteolyticus TaxID=1131652 RepID=A0AAD4L0T5_9EURO|nr:peptidase M24, structural domain-containing protein [Talaromyces proteolyticus]KAH8704144.1 peptidase M24, structural domain-containing protein [Talaromyces proteolyticus]
MWLTSHASYLTMLEKYGSLELQSPRRSQGSGKYFLKKIEQAALLLLGFFSYHHFSYYLTNDAEHSPLQLTSAFEQFQECSIQNFQDTGLYFLDSAIPIALDDYEERRNRLAQALIADAVDAFVIEPGYTFKYYANVSQREWEVWEPEERPFLMVIQPDRLASGEIIAKTSFLCPSFEAERARLLNMPFSEPAEIIPWEEHWNPYITLKHSDIFSALNHTPRLMVDEEMRDFIQRGLGSAGFDITGLGGEAERVRQIKTAKEVGILRAVNTGTVEAVRQMRKCLYPGLMENEVAEALDNTLRSAGLDPFFDIVLFDENAANPHGGTNGSKVLEPETFVLIDVGAHLFGYSSDICRTFFPPFLEKPANGTLPPASIQEKLKIWDIVFEAQTQSSHQFLVNSTAAGVDIAARKVISDAGYGDAFTHRVGHGIGIKAHESPYLNKGNQQTLLKAGMAFTSEPGIYLVDMFGVRHEDIYLVREEGEPELLSGRRAAGPWDP